MILYDGNGTRLVMENNDSKPYEGKKWAVLGDSISMSHASRLYHTLIGEKLGFTVQNLATNGKGYAHVRDTQLPAISDDVDLITIMAGTNDMTSGGSPGNARLG